MPNHTCCVPGCFNRSSREKHLKFYRIPKDCDDRKVYLVRIRREKDFVVTQNTRICSAHWEGGVKTDDNPYPTVFPLRPSIPPKKRKPPTPRDEDPVYTKRKYTKYSPFQDKGIQCVAQVCDVECQCNTEAFSHEQLESLRSELESATAKIRVLESKLSSTQFCIERFIDSDEDFTYYTGFPSYQTFAIFWEYLGDRVNTLSHWNSSATTQRKPWSLRGRERKLTAMNELFLVSVRLRLGLQLNDLAHRFQISRASVSRIFATWINFLYHEFKGIDNFPTRDQIQRDMPKCFESYSSIRVILDATEIEIEKPSSLYSQSATWSAYKNCNTFKALIGIAPAGYITFVSPLYCGNISDQKITEDSGILDLLESGDSVMADKGFDIEQLLVQRGILLNIPPFGIGNHQLSAAETITTRRIASLRIHVKRAIGRVKNFKLFACPIPLSMVSVVDQAFYVCCMLTKFQSPLVS